ncbi:MAG: hypothetical protein JXA54_08045 [Candidatus Heimdallarchaeota archaeon]|nr:hypothetical protein [Candidatus Heimdallarchaeota archaeon]
MALVKASNSSKGKKIKITNAFIGIAIGIFEDNGPIARYYNVKLSKEVINKMVVHGMSAVHGGENLFGGLFGPLPIFDVVDLRYLIFTFKVKASNTKDTRIAEHGRVCSVFLILKKSQERYALNNHLTIEKLINDFIVKNWKKELEITRDSMLDLYESINRIIKVIDIRSFSYGEAGLIEYADSQMILDEGILAILDMKANKVYIYLPQERYSAKMRIKALEKMEELSYREFNSQLKIQKYRDYLKFKKILDKLSIQVIK